MTNAEFVKKVNEMIEKYNISPSSEYYPDYEFFGIRFENKAREVGDYCECSKHNPDREDDRDFPVYGTEEYEEMPELDGTSAWRVERENGEWIYSFTNKRAGWEEKELKLFDAAHCYLIAGNQAKNHDDCDPNEVVIVDAEVLEILF